jgi:hypothetical protein
MEPKYECSLSSTQMTGAQWFRGKCREKRVVHGF